MRAAISPSDEEDVAAWTREWAKAYGAALARIEPDEPEPDDDVDALDTELRRYWYFSADHEASKGLEPGAVLELGPEEPDAP